jgi:hypothetical protein
MIQHDDDSKAVGIPRGWVRDGVPANTRKEYERHQREHGGRCTA